MAKLTISKVMLLLVLEVSVTPTGWAKMTIVVVPALENDKSLGHINSAYPPAWMVFAAAGVPGEEK
mgnify:CR=1 FL=1